MPLPQLCPLGTCSCHTPVPSQEIAWFKECDSVPGHFELRHIKSHHTLTHLKHLHSTQRQEVRFRCPSCLALWAQLPAPADVCVAFQAFVCELVSTRLQADASADPDSQTSCFMDYATNRHTLSRSLGDDWPCGSSRSFHKHDYFWEANQEWATGHGLPYFSFMWHLKTRLQKLHCLSVLIL